MPQDTARAERDVGPPKPVETEPITDVPADSIEREVKARFLGANRWSRVLFLKDESIVHSWIGRDGEQFEAITTRRPAGHRECKVLRDGDAQAFLTCMYWFTGPGGGRVDGIIFDLRRRLAGEFFSAAISIRLLETLCFPESAVGPMPAFTLTEWNTIDRTPSSPAQITVNVTKEGWSTQQAAALRKTPEVERYCKCFDAEHCSEEPVPPRNNAQITFYLRDQQLNPTEDSKQTLEEISHQWGHHDFVQAWNLQMRGYR